MTSDALMHLLSRLTPALLRRPQPGPAADNRCICQGFCICACPDACCCGRQWESSPHPLPAPLAELRLESMVVNNTLELSMLEAQAESSAGSAQAAAQDNGRGQGVAAPERRDRPNRRAWTCGVRWPEVGRQQVLQF